MTHLLAISIGPVQEFIAAARRTRDLWFGSYLLSEISKAVAKSVKSEGTLIFPHPDTDLESADDKVNVANVILAEVPNDEPQTIAETARRAAQNCWERFATQARTDAASAISSDIWANQVGDVIEFYAAWVEQTGNYPDDRKKLMRLLAGRKNCRDFQPQPFIDAGRPKSSLDGQRTSVLVQPEYRSQREQLRKSWPTSLRLAAGEELDIVGVTKRLGKKPGEPRPSYASVARVAADPWLRGIKDHPLFGELKSACGSVPGLNPVREEVYNGFPFEGTVVFPARHPDLEVELKEQSIAPLRKVRDILQKLGSEPNPYLAVLAADGDKMGAAISKLPDANANREFSTALAGFANEARKIVTHHSGVLVYAGGDDVLVFLPVDQCLDCARDLHDDFGTRLAAYGKPTLSVGIAIAHFMENLEDLLQYGRHAEKAAKEPDRNGLAVQLHRRGGAPVNVRSPWTDNPDQRLARFAELMRAEAIPGKLPYDLRGLANHYRGWKHDSADERRLLADAMRKDVIRVIRDKQPRSGRQYMPEIEAMVKDLQTPTDLQQFSEQLLVSAQLAASLKQAGQGAK
jgi:CRISPR-associated protein Cmr2